MKKMNQEKNLIILHGKDQVLNFQKKMMKARNEFIKEIENDFGTGGEFKLTGMKSTEDQERIKWKNKLAQ